MQVLGIALLFIMLLMLKHLSWHSGTSVLTSTITHAFGDIMDTTAVVLYSSFDRIWSIWTYFFGIAVGRMISFRLYRDLIQWHVYHLDYWIMMNICLMAMGRDMKE